MRRLRATPNVASRAPLNPHRLPVQRDVEPLAFLLGADAQADEGVDELQRDPGADRAPQNRHADADRLGEELRRVAFQQPRYAGFAARRAHRGRGEDAGEQGAEGAADAVHAEHVERIVVAEPVFQRRARPVADAAGERADDDALPGQDVAGGGGDRAEAGDRAGNQPEHRGLAARGPFQRAPGERAGASRQVRGDDGEGGARSRAQRRTAVEAEPADPQEAGADHGERQIERRQVLAPVALPGAEHQRRDEAGDAGVDVDHRAAGEVDQPEARQEAAAPHPVGGRDIDDEQPQRAEEKKG